MAASPTDLEMSAEQANLCLEDRISASRQASYESQVGTPKDWPDWKGGHYRYVQEEVRRRHPMSASFTPGEPSLRLGVESNQYLYRVERIDALLGRFATTTGAPIGPAEVMHWISDQRSAITPGDSTTEMVSSPYASALSELTDFFNDERNDGRPTFVAFAAEFPDLELRDDWAEHFCKRCGLSHFFTNSEVTLALFRYSVNDVLDAYSVTGQTMFAVPTAIDHPMANVYFAAPRGADWGHAVGLAPQDDCGHLVAELIHVRIDYRADHWVAVDTLSRRCLPPTEVDSLRSAHLRCIRRMPGLAAYGTGCT